MQFTIYYVEQIPHTNFLSRRQLHQSHSCWDVFVLRHPESNYVTTWRPWEVSTGTKLKTGHFNFQLEILQAETTLLTASECCRQRSCLNNKNRHRYITEGRLVTIPKQIFKQLFKFATSPVLTHQYISQKRKGYTQSNCQGSRNKWAKKPTPLNYRGDHLLAPGYTQFSCCFTEMYFKNSHRSQCVLCRNSTLL